MGHALSSGDAPIPEPPSAGRELFTALYRRLLVANVIGATIAFVYFVFVSPPQPAPSPHEERWLLIAIGPAYFAIAAVIGHRVFERSVRPVWNWLDEGRAPTAEETEIVLRVPWGAALRTALTWVIAATVFGVQTATHHPAAYVAGVACGIALAGLTTAAVSYLLCERAMRPVFAQVLAGEVPDDRRAARVLGTRARLLVSWALGSGVALVAIALAFLGRGDDTGDELIAPVLFLVVVGLFAGGALLAAAARSVVEPVDRVRSAVERVGNGSLDADVVVDDGGEIGFLQAGFNRMVAGLRERERIRAVFGTYVDRDVADHILGDGTALSGEEVDVTVMFIDIRGFTGIAERLSAAEVVTTVNRMFERVVPIIHRHGGHVDKYVGDGLLAVFGAPRRQHDHADEAVAAAREIAAAVDVEFDGELRIGVGLNSGPVVAGNVGGAGRLEFSVIGDAVNVAARVEAATRTTGDVILLSGHTRALLSDAGVAAGLEPRPPMQLKGKAQSVDLYALGVTDGRGGRSALYADHHRDRQAR